MEIDENKIPGIIMIWAIVVIAYIMVITTAGDYLDMPVSVVNLSCDIGVIALSIYPGKILWGYYHKEE